MNRFDKPRQYDYSFDRYMPELYMPNFEAWGQVVTNRAKEDAAMQELLAKMPKYIEEGEYSYKNDKGETITEKYGDTEAFKNYAQKIEGFQKAINEAALAGDGNRYRQLMKEAQREISKDWGAMGTATILEERQKGFTEGMKKLKEYEEKATDGGKWAAVNKNYAQLQFLKGVGVYKPDDSGYKGIIEPSVFPYVDIKEEALKYMKEAGYNDIEIENLPETNGWQFRSRTKSITDEALKGLNEHLRSENFAKQYEIERFGVFQKSDFSDIQAGVDEHNQKVDDVNKQFDKTQALNLDLENEGDKNADKVKKLQEGLKAFGLYNGEIDGKYGPKTAEAAKKFKSYTKEQLGVQELTPQQYVQKGLESKYRTVAYGTIDYLKSDVLSQPYLLWLKNNYDVGLENLRQSIVKEANSPSATYGQDVPIDYGNTQKDSQEATANRGRAEDALFVSTSRYFWNKGTESSTVTKTNMDSFYNATIEIYNKNPKITAEELKNELWNEWRYNVKDANVLLLDLQNEIYQDAYNEYQNAKITEANFEGKIAESVDVTMEVLERNDLFESGNASAGVEYVLAPGITVVNPNTGNDYYALKETVRKILNKKDSELNELQKTIKAEALKRVENLPAEKRGGGYRKSVQYTPSKGTQTYAQLETNREAYTNKSVQAAVIAVKPEYAPLWESGDVALSGGRIGYPSLLGATTGIEIPLVKSVGGKQVLDPLIVPLNKVFPQSVRKSLAANMVIDCYYEDGKIKSGADGDPLHVAGIFAFVENTGKDILTNQGAEARMKKTKDGDPAIPLIGWQYTEGDTQYQYQITGRKGANGKAYYSLQTDDNFASGAPVWRTIDNFEDIESAEAAWGVFSVKPKYYEKVKNVAKRGSERFKFLPQNNK
jgi:hypothetical protein